MLSTIRRHALATAATLAERYPHAPEPLAQPPAGSGLKPVMGSYGPPGIGYSLNALTDLVGFGRRYVDEFGEIAWGGFMGRRAVLATGPEAAEAILLNRDKAFSAEQGWEFLIGPFFHGAIMLKDFDEHIYHRRIMQQAFTRQRLIGYLDLTTPGIERGLAAWQPGRRFPMYTASKQLLLELATEVFVGTEIGPEGKRLERAFEDAVRGGQAIVRTNVPGGAWSRGLRGRAVLADYFRREIPAKRAGDGTDLFSVLCRAETDDGATFTAEQIVDHMIFVLMAAHDTSTITLSMMGYLLGRHPEWQDAVRAESQAIGKPAIGYDDLDRLPTLDLVFKETLRMYSPVGQQLRQTLTDTELLGHFIPAGTPVGVTPYLTQRMDRWWHDPDTFDPGRFAPERREDASHRYAYAPFGGGAHKCIGKYFADMNVKAILHSMLLQYRWSVPKGYTVPIEWGTGPTPADGLPIALERLSATDVGRRRTA